VTLAALDVTVRYGGDVQAITRRQRVPRACVLPPSGAATLLDKKFPASWYSIRVQISDFWLTKESRSNFEPVNACAMSHIDVPGEGARMLVRRIAAVFCIVLLAACGSGGGGSGNSSSGSGGGGGGGGGSPPPPPPVSAADAARLLTQSTFGPDDASISAVQNAGVNGWIAQQTGMPATLTIVSDLDARLAQLRMANASANLSANQFYEEFWKLAATAPDQLRQRMRFALSQIFVISLNDSTIANDVRGAGSYYDMLGANAFVNYRTLLEQVTLHPMMGIYLTYMSNQKEDPTGTRTPDQNYAREVMQLMSIGLVKLNIDGTPQLDANGQPIPTYTQDDILGLSKVFTGIAWYSPNPTNSTFNGGSRDPNADNTPMIFYPNFHSTSQKQFLGVTIPASSSPDVAGDLKIALDTIYNHPNVGPFIAFRLIQQFVTSNPSHAYIQRVATVFNNNGSGVRGDMAAVITAVLTDPEARDATVVSSKTFGKLREPVIRLANWMRGFGATSQSGTWLMTSTSANTSLSQSPLTSGSVFNFWRPGYVPPNTQLGAQNLYAPEFQGVDEVTVAGYLNTMRTVVDTGIGTSSDIRSAYTTEISLANDATALTNRVNQILLYGQMSATLQQRITDAVNGVTIPSGASVTQAQINAALLNRAKIAVFLAMASPEYIVQR
jgi:uncharacterized protein (DUF1800 family)